MTSLARPPDSSLTFAHWEITRYHDGSLRLKIVQSQSGRSIINIDDSYRSLSELTTHLKAFAFLLLAETSELVIDLEELPSTMKC
jgi:hypothetical protein